jgi:hypothetical protein
MGAKKAPKTTPDKSKMVTNGYKPGFFLVEYRKSEGFLNSKCVFDSRRGHGLIFQ